jgi:hypothetical protein
VFNDVLVYVYEMVHVYLLVYVLFLYVRYATLLEADCAVDEPNSSKTVRRTRSSKASGFSFYIFCLCLLIAYNNVYFFIYCIILMG